MKSIKSKILVNMLPVVLAGALLIGVVSVVLNYKGTYAVLESTVGPIAEVAGKTIEEDLEGYWATLTEAASLDVFHTSKPSDKALIERSEGIASRNGFMYLGKLDAQGIGPSGTNNSDQDYFKWCKERLSPVISNPIHDGAQVVFLMASPILTNGKFDGLVYGAVDASFLTEIVSGLHIGESGQAYILDEYGDVIGHPDPSYVVDGVNIIDQAKSDRSVADIAAIHERMIRGESGFDTYKFDGDSKIFGYAPILGEQGWSIGIEASKSEFMASLKTSIMITVLIVLAVIIVAVFIAVRLAIRLRPVWSVWICFRQVICTRRFRRFIQRMKRPA